MGHVPSKDHCAEPFVMDVFAKTGPERLVAIAMTTYYFRSANDPLFQKFCHVRAESHVRNWYWRPTGVPLTELPEVPSDDVLFKYYVEDATAYVDLKLPPQDFLPIPVMIIKMNEADCTEMPTVENSTVQGCIGSRHFDVRKNDEGEQRVEILPSRGIAQIILGHSFYNEIRAMSCFRLGCACYRFFCTQRCGVFMAHWPLGTGYETSTANLPLFKLTQQLNAMVVDFEAWVDDGIVFVEQGDRLYCGVEGASLVIGAEAMAASVVFMPTPPVPANLKDAGSQRLLPQHSIRITRQHGVFPPAPVTRKVGHLNDIVERAKPKWKEANQAVLADRQKNQEARKQAEPPSERSPLDGKGVEVEDQKPTKQREPRRIDETSLEERAIEFSHIPMTDVFSFNASVVQANMSPHPPPSLAARGNDSPKGEALFPDQYSPLPTGEGACRGALPELVLPVGPALLPDMKVYIGDCTPVTIRTLMGQWVPRFWRNPLQYLIRSTWQPHLDSGFVAYSVEHSTMLLYDQDWKPEVQVGCSVFVFLAAGEAVFQVCPLTGEYLPGEAA